MKALAKFLARGIFPTSANSLQNCVLVNKWFCTALSYSKVWYLPYNYGENLVWLCHVHSGLSGHQPRVNYQLPFPPLSHREAPRTTLIPRSMLIAHSLRPATVETNGYKMAADMGRRPNDALHLSRSALLIASTCVIQETSPCPGFALRVRRKGNFFGLVNGAYLFPLVSHILFLHHECLLSPVLTRRSYVHHLPYHDSGEIK